MFDRIDCAPMEGITRAIYRRRHHVQFGGIDRYFTPFLAPSGDGVFSEKELREVLPAACAGVPTVPQLLAGRAEHFLWAAKLMGELGYDEVNLNLGCPSGTVVAKHKGAGLLAYPEELRAFLEAVFNGLAGEPLKISVKTRIGMENADEFRTLIEIFNEYPICDLTIHPRLRRQFYKGQPDLQAFADGLSRAAMPVCYNGDVFCPEDARALQERFPAVRAVMLGRGLIADSALARVLRGGQALTAEELRAFHDGLLEDYCGCILGEVNILHKMKELWNYWACLFPADKKGVKALRKAKNLPEYRRAAAAVLSAQPCGHYTPEM